MLTAKQKKCLELMIEGKLKQKEIAAQIKVSEQTICTWKKNADFMAEYESMLKGCMKSLAASAFQTEINLLNAKSEMVRLMSAKDILDRAGFKPDDNLTVNGIGKVVIIDDCNQ